jgi:hypothetical protein
LADLSSLGLALPREAVASLRTGLEGLGTFEDCSKAMPAVSVREENLPRVQQAFEFLLAWVERFAKGR